MPHQIIWDFIESHACDFMRKEAAAFFGVSRRVLDPSKVQALELIELF